MMMMEYERSAVARRIAAIKVQLKTTYASDLPELTKCAKCCRMLDEMNGLLEVLKSAQRVDRPALAATPGLSFSLQQPRLPLIGSFQMPISQRERQTFERRLRELDSELLKLPHRDLPPGKHKTRLLELRAEVASILATLEAAGDE